VYSSIPTFQREFMYKEPCHTLRHLGSIWRQVPGAVFQSLVTALVLICLHWLRVLFKVVVLTYLALHGNSPRYQHHLFSDMGLAPEINVMYDVCMMYVGYMSWCFTRVTNMPSHRRSSTSDQPHRQQNNMQLYSSNDSKQKIKRNNHRHTKKTNKLANSSKTAYMTISSSQFRRCHQRTRYILHLVTTTTTTVQAHQIY